MCIVLHTIICLVTYIHIYTYMMSMTLYDDSTLDAQMACHCDSPPSSCHQPCDSKVNQVKRAMGSYKGSQVFLGSVLWTGQEARTQLLN